MSVGILDTSLWESHHHIHSIWMSKRNKYFPPFHSKGHNLSCDAWRQTWQYQFNHLQIVHSWLWAGSPQLECLIMKSTKHDETIHDYQTRFQICFFFNFKPTPLLLYYLTSLLIRPSQLAELSRSEIDPELFSHSAYKVFCDIRDKSAIFNVSRQNRHFLI